MGDDSQMFWTPFFASICLHWLALHHPVMALKATIVCLIQVMGVPSKALLWPGIYPTSYIARASGISKNLYNIYNLQFLPASQLFS